MLRQKVYLYSCIRILKEQKSGTECGIGVKDYNDVKAGDQIEVFKRTEIQRTIQ